MKKILAIDDDHGTLIVLREVMRSAGYEVFFAEDTVSAVTRYLEIKPDIILLDLEMPGGGGMAVFKRLRGVMGHSVPVVFVTGHAERELGSALRFHQVKYIRKPFSADKLIDSVNALLGVAKPPLPPPPPKQGA